MAFAFAYETARDATYRSLHFHGGYGFMMEYDIQLYYRRARGWANVCDDPERRLPPGGRSPLRSPGRSDVERGGRLMDFRLGDKTDAFRDEVREFLDEQMTPELEEQLYRTGVSNDEGFTKALAEKGWLALGWPVEWGGQGREPLEVIGLQEELQQVDAPTYGIGTTIDGRQGSSRRRHRRAEGRDPAPALRGRDHHRASASPSPRRAPTWPRRRRRPSATATSGSSTARRCSRRTRHIADYVFLLARTNPDVPKHKGLTMFLVPMDQPGRRGAGGVHAVGRAHEHHLLQRRAGLRRAGASATSTAAGRRHDACRCRTSTRPASARASTRLLDERRGVGRRGRPTTTAAADRGPRRRSRLGRAATELEVPLLLQRRVAVDGRRASVPEAEGPMSKLFSSEALERRAEDLTEMIGPDALRSYFDPTAPGARPHRAHAALLARHHDLRRHQRGAAQHHRPARPRPPSLIWPRLVRPRWSAAAFVDERLAADLGGLAARDRLDELDRLGRPCSRPDGTWRRR